MRHYITQNGFWWSASAETWQAFVTHAIAHDGDYDLDKFPGLKALKSRPSSVRIERGSHRDRYVDIEGHRIHRILDWTPEDWRDALDDEIPLQGSNPSSPAY